MSKLRLAFYGDDFTGSTDAMEQLAYFGFRTMLFTQPPSPAQLKSFPDLDAIGVAGTARSMTPHKMASELRPVFKQLQALGVPHVHYKVCSTFDSSPTVGSIGCVMDLAGEIFGGPFMPLLVAAPALGRYCVFGNLFARFGTGGQGEVHRLDRHPAISRHPVTPMTEADLRWHLARQTKKNVVLFDILKVALPEKEGRTALRKLLAEKPDVVLFDALVAEHMKRIGGLMDHFASRKQPLFSIGSSGVEMALGAHWRQKAGAAARPNDRVPRRTGGAAPVLVGSGSCSPVTERQMVWGLSHGFAEVALNAAALASANHAGTEMHRATVAAVKLLRAGRSVILHTTRSGSDPRIATELKCCTGEILGTALGRILRGALEQAKVQRLCVAGGDTASFAARALGIEALEMIAPLAPGAPLCRAWAPDSPADGLEVVFKGGQVGPENFFESVKRGGKSI